MTAREPEQDDSGSFATQLAELQNRPVGDGSLDRARRRALAWVERATEKGPLQHVAEVGWLAFRRDSSIGGSVLAAALAYRIFVWALPLALVLVLCLGGLQSSPSSAEDVLRDAGIGGYFAQSIGSATSNVEGWARLLGVCTGLAVLVYESFALLRAARAVTSLAWRVPLRRSARPVRDTSIFMGLIVGFFISSSSVASIRAALDFPLDVIGVLAAYALLPVLFLAVAWWLLPNGAERWTDVVPGSLSVGVAVAALGLFNSLVLFPWLAQKQQTYGVLGIAAGLLFSFFLIGRAIVLAASLDAVLSERRKQRRLAR
jgi:uncharacterized BrkB/YihY/UPF0761 family membrane protein